MALFSQSLIARTDSLPPLKDGQSPQTVEEAWAGYDPRAEPLDVEIIKEWEQEGVVLRAVRYRIGTFKGQKSWMGALYGFPKEAKDQRIKSSFLLEIRYSTKWLGKGVPGIRTFNLPAPPPGDASVSRRGNRGLSTKARFAM